MIQYRFTKGILSYPASLENDEQAKDFAEFINADYWERDTTIIKLRDGDMVCEFEIDTVDLKNIVPDFKNVKIWESKLIKL